MEDKEVITRYQRWREARAILRDLEGFGLSQYRVQKDLDIAWTTIQRWKAITHYPSAKHLSKLKKYGARVKNDFKRRVKRSIQAVKDAESKAQKASR